MTSRWHCLAVVLLFVTMTMFLANQIRAGATEVDSNPRATIISSWEARRSRITSADIVFETRSRISAGYLNAAVAKLPPKVRDRHIRHSLTSEPHAHSFRDHIIWDITRLKATCEGMIFDLPRSQFTSHRHVSA